MMFIKKKSKKNAKETDGWVWVDIIVYVLIPPISTSRTWFIQTHSQTINYACIFSKIKYFGFKRTYILQQQRFWTGPAVLHVLLYQIRMKIYTHRNMCFPTTMLTEVLACQCYNSQLNLWLRNLNSMLFQAPNSLCCDGYWASKELWWKEQKTNN